MPDLLCISVHWLDARYHGQTDDGRSPEWPPSPLRLFQAMLAGAKRNQWTDALAESFRWLEMACERKPPLVIAPDALHGSPYTLFVPNNDTDKPADAQRSEKVVRPTILPDDAAVHYLWPISPDESAHAQRVARSARHLTALGWGIDLAVADGRIIDVGSVADLCGVRWKPLASDVFSQHVIRVPTKGTLARLELVHESFLNRLADGVSRPALPFSTYTTVPYQRSDAAPARPAIAFKLVDQDNKMYHYNHARLIHVSAWVRHAAIELTKTHPRLRDLGEYVSGHGERSRSNYAQLSYFPLPSIGHRHANPDVRRIMIAEPAGSSGKALQRLAPFLHGTKLSPLRDGNAAEAEVVRLIRIGPDDGVVRCYLNAAHAWASVTPVILPGHDDHKPAKTRGLIEKALRQSGIDQPCEFEWSAISYFPKSLAAYKYDRQKRPTGYVRPEHLLNQTAVHMRLTFEHPFAGPLAIGSRRHCGLGLFARVE